MDKKMIRNIYMLYVFFIGLSGPLYFIAFNKKNIITSLYSPLPTVFSKGDASARRAHKMEIFLDTTSSHVYRFKRVKGFYRDLGGPHRLKVMFMTRLGQESYLSKKKHTPFLKYIFCREDLNLEYLNKEKVRSIFIKQYGKEIVRVYCQK